MSSYSIPASNAAALEQALARDPQALGLDEALAVLAGLAASPETGLGGDDALWPRLIAPAPDGELIGILRSARRALAGRTPALPLADRVPTLRTALAAQGLDGFVVPHGDEHQSEFIPAASQRLAWLTGFTGSAGTAVVLTDKAAIFVDGRYTLQVRNQVDVAVLQPQHLIDTPSTDWIAENLPEGARLGLDPWLHSADAVERLRTAVEKAGGDLVLVDENPLDAVWVDRPARPLAPVIPHPEEYAGEASESKRRRLAEKLAEQGVAAAVVSQPDSVAWLLNIRGGDTAHTPLPLSFALLEAGGQVALFCDPRKLLPETRKHLGNGVRLEAPDALGAALDRLGADKANVLLDRQSTPAWIVNRLSNAGATLRAGGDPCVAPKAAKNPVELAGCRSAHERDAIAVARFLAWIDAHGASGEVGEVQAADQLLKFRSELPGFRDQSFPTISGFGPNGAIVHYRAMPGKDCKLAAGSLYLVDSGAQFPDGTTDITRTVAIGEATAVMRRAFTRVLQGHIGLATARFPVGTTGVQLDALARAPLWADGLDFDHGTGHGVGSYLGVHEGPQRVAKTGAVAFVPGMIVSNEPGYYKTDAFGIRTENLLVVRESAVTGDGVRAFLEFETVTLAPIDRRLIDLQLLSGLEREWINTYHARVAETVAPHLDEASRIWLLAATAPL